MREGVSCPVGLTAQAPQGLPCGVQRGRGTGLRCSRLLSGGLTVCVCVFFFGGGLLTTSALSAGACKGKQGGGTPQ